MLSFFFSFYLSKKKKNTCFSFEFLIEYSKRLFVMVYGVDEMLELYWV